MVVSIDLLSNGDKFQVSVKGHVVTLRKLCSTSMSSLPSECYVCCIEEMPVQLLEELTDWKATNPPTEDIYVLNNTVSAMVSQRNHELRLIIKRQTEVNKLSKE